MDKISKLPYSYKRGFDLQKEIADIQSLFHKSNSLAIAQNTELFAQGLSGESKKWISELDAYQRNYENTKQNSDLMTQENISKILNSLQNEISSIISKCKQIF